jgi:hypothetical protein
MKKLSKLSLLLAPLLMCTVLSAQAAKAPIVTPITFYNNTNYPVQVAEDSFIGDMLNCPGNPYNACLKLQRPITITPHSTGILPLETATTSTHTGGVGFSINLVGENTMQIILPAMANPAGAFIYINFCSSTNSCYYTKANAEIVNNNQDVMPKYTASIAQSQHFDPITRAIDMVANATVVSINPIQQ